jgi:riboflavin synthase
MFTGIVETVGTVLDAYPSGSNMCFRIRSGISSHLKPDQSVAHDGACLTVERVEGDTHCVTAIQETLSKTVLCDWQPGRRVNLERSMVLGGRIDGHLVQGHVDTTGHCIVRNPRDGSTELTFSFPEAFATLVIEKGSICINGISLTAFSVGRDQLTVAIIPYTWEHTAISDVSVGTAVNLEFDMLGKYVARLRG